MVNEGCFPLLLLFCLSFFILPEKEERKNIVFIICCTKYTAVDGQNWIEVCTLHYFIQANIFQKVFFSLFIEQLDGFYSTSTVM